MLLKKPWFSCRSIYVSLMCLSLYIYIRIGTKSVYIYNILVNERFNEQRIYISTFTFTHAYIYIHMYIHTYTCLYNYPRILRIGNWTISSRNMDSNIEIDAVLCIPSWCYPGDPSGWRSGCRKSEVHALLPTRGATWIYSISKYIASLWQMVNLSAF